MIFPLPCFPLPGRFAVVATAPPCYAPSHCAEPPLVILRPPEVRQWDKPQWACNRMTLIKVSTKQEGGTYVYIYIRMYIYRYTYIYMIIYARINMFVYLYTYKCTYIYIYIRMCMCIYIYTHVCGSVKWEEDNFLNAQVLPASSPFCKGCCDKICASYLYFC